MHTVVSGNSSPRRAVKALPSKDLRGLTAISPSQPRARKGCFPQRCPRFGSYDQMKDRTDQHLNKPPKREARPLYGLFASTGKWRGDRPGME